MRWRLAGAVGLAAALILAVLTPQRPDLIVEADGRTMAVRQADGRLSIAGLRSGKFSAGRWLEAEGDERALSDPSLLTGLTCDKAACTGVTPQGARVALVLDREQLRAWCRQTDVGSRPGWRRAPARPGP